MAFNSLIIGGPTASSKSQIAKQIAKKVPSRIINADSMQLYSDLNILTNRPSNKDMEEYDHRMYGILGLNQLSNLGWWYKNVKKEMDDSIRNGFLPIIVGGTGLYCNSLEAKISEIPDVNKRIKNKILRIHKRYGNEFFYEKLKKIDPSSYVKLNKNDTQRLIRAIEVRISSGKSIEFWKNKKSKKINNFRNLFVVIISEREELYKKINQRFLNMIDEGVIDEVKDFLKKKVPLSHPTRKALGMKFIIQYINNEISFKKMIELSQMETRNYAKRQITWFKNQPKNPHYLCFSEANEYILKKIENLDV